MSATVAFEFRDDGSVVMTHRSKKGADPQTSEVRLPGHVGILGGDDDATVTAHVLVLDNDAWDRLRRRSGDRRCVVVAVGAWSEPAAIYKPLDEDPRYAELRARLNVLHGEDAETHWPTYDVCDPHCDGRVLHAPGACSTCDDFPEMQMARFWWGINFTGESDPSKLPCPAELRRDVETIHQWGGNRPTEDR